MRYYEPNNVRSPRDFVDSVSVIFDGGPESYSFAKIVWEGNECYGIRWNVARREWDDPNKISGAKICVGVPSSRGYPTWFILPYDFLHKIADVDTEQDLHNVLQLMLAPQGTAISGVLDSREKAIKELRQFTVDAEELTIIDPYLLQPSNANVNSYVDDLKQCTRINGKNLKKLHLVTNEKNITKNAHTEVKQLCRDNNCNFSVAYSDDIHDRVWIKNRKEAIVVGTSFGGIGSKLCFILPLPDTDLKNLYEHLRENNLLR